MQLGIKPFPEALAIAKELDLDLVEVAPMANPPVCRIMDFGKFKFDEAQRAKESRRKTVHVGIKEMKYRPKIGPGDFDTKTRQVAKFLSEGHKVKITIMFRGREVYHPEHGKRILDRIAEQMEGIAKIEAEPKLDNRNMIMVLAPDKRARQAAAVEGQPINTATSGRRAPSAATVDSQPGTGRARRRPPRPRGTEVRRQLVRAAGSAKSQHQPKRDDAMPKMKTDRGAAKRIKVTASGRLRRAQGLPLAHPREEEQRPHAPAGPRGRHLQGGRAGHAPDARHLSAGDHHRAPRTPT